MSARSGGSSISCSPAARWRPPARAKRSKIRKRPGPDILQVIAAAADRKQAVDLEVLDVSKSSAIVDHLVIAGAESEPQLRAIEREIDAELRKNNVKNFRWEGVLSSGWLVLDLGSIPPGSILFLGGKR